MSKIKGYQCFTCWHQFWRVIAPDMKCPICGTNAYQTSEDWSEEWGSTRSEKRLKKERDEARASLAALREACSEYLRLHDSDLDYEAGNKLEVIRSMIQDGDHIPASGKKVGEGEE